MAGARPDSFSYAVAGVKVITNAPVAGLPASTDAPAELELTLAWRAPAPAAAAPPAGDGPWHAVPNPGYPAQAQLRGDGKLVVVTLHEPAAVIDQAMVRWLVPFAAALQGRVILHAAAAARDDVACAFIGPSGVGKSTAAEHLRARGWSLLATDLLPCVVDEAAVRTRPANVVLRAAGFLARAPQATAAVIEALSPRAALALLAANGFGELDVAAVRARQFDFYCRVAAVLPCYRLTVPDDLARLPRALDRWEAVIARAGRG